MPPATVCLRFDQHTPVLAFRVRALLAELQRRGMTETVRVEVVLVTLSQQQHDWEGEDLQAAYGGTRVTILNERHHHGRLRDYLHWRAWRSAWRFLRHLRRERPRLVLVEGYDRPESIAAVLTGWLFRWRVGVLHDTQFDYGDFFERNASVEFCKGLLVRRYHLFLCSGQASARYTRFLAGPKRPVFEHAWDIVDNRRIAQLAQAESDDARLFQHLGLPAGQPYFLVMARFIAYKNIPLLLDAYARYLALATAAPVPLVLCGRGPREQEYRERCETLGIRAQVHIRPWLDYALVPRAARQSVAVILPSHREQWGMVINEALAAGAPVLVSDRCGARELVRNGVNGYTFSPDDPEHLALLLERLGHDRAHRDQLAAQAGPGMEAWSEEQMVAAWLAAMEHAGLPVGAPPGRPA